MNDTPRNSRIDAKLIGINVSHSEKLARLAGESLRGDSARMLYSWLIAHQDGHGNFFGSPELVYSDVVPKLYRHGWTPRFVGAKLQELVEVGLIEPYEVGGERYIHIWKSEDFQKYRTDRQRRCRFPQPKDADAKGRKGKASLKTRAKNKANAKEICARVVEYLNLRTGKKFRANSKVVQRLVNGRLTEGYKEKDFRTVIDNKTKDWVGNREFEPFLRPETLFAAKHFDSYLNQGPPRTTFGMWDDETPILSIAKLSTMLADGRAVKIADGVYHKRKWHWEEQDGKAVRVFDEP